MNSTTYEELERAGIIDSLKARGEKIEIDESLPDGVIRRTESLSVEELKLREEARIHRIESGGQYIKARSGYTSPGQRPRNKAKAKAARAARKRNRNR